MPGSTNSPERFSSFSDSAVSSSKNSRACVRFTSKRSAKCEKSSDLPILRASDITAPPRLERARDLNRIHRARSDDRGKHFEKRRILARRSRQCQTGGGPPTPPFCPRSGNRGGERLARAAARRG